ncbi:MAG: type II toxin-antitoxin system PemK/MazF family toxin [Chloroflexota bacterium]
MSAQFPRRGELYWVNLDPSIGSEIAKTRPCVIVSNDVGNQYSARVIVASLTSGGTDRVYPFEVLVPAGEAGLSADSKVALDQIRTVDKRRLGRRIGTLNQGHQRQVDRALRLSLDLDGGNTFA